jgi:hypothetical protein
MVVKGDYSDGQLYLSIEHDTFDTGLKGVGKIDDTWVNTSQIVDAGYGDNDSKFVNTVVNMIQKYNNEGTGV